MNDAVQYYVMQRVNDCLRGQERGSQKVIVFAIVAFAAPVIGFIRRMRIRVGNPEARSGAGGFLGTGNSNDGHDQKEGECGFHGISEGSVYPR